MRSSFEVRPTRIDINSLRLEEKAASAILRSDLGFDRCTFLRDGFDLATAALYLLEIRSNSAEFGSSINGLRAKSLMELLDSAAR